VFSPTPPVDRPVPTPHRAQNVKASSFRSRNPKFQMRDRVRYAVSHRRRHPRRSVIDRKRDRASSPQLQSNVTPLPPSTTRIHAPSCSQNPNVTPLPSVSVSFPFRQSPSGCSQLRPCPSPCPFQRGSRNGRRIPPSNERRSSHLAVIVPVTPVAFAKTNVSAPAPPFRFLEGRKPGACIDSSRY